MTVRRSALSPMSSVLSLGPVVLAGLFLVRALSPNPDPTLLGIFVLLAAGAGSMAVGWRPGAVVVLLFGLALFQPITAREFAFSLGSVDSPWWRWWAVGSLLALGWSLVAAATMLSGDLTGRRIAVSSAAGLTVGAALVPLFAVLAPQPNFGTDLDADELAALPVIELLNHRYDPPIVTVQADGVLRARLDNPSELPHTVTVDELGLEVFVPAGRWSVIEIDGADLAEQRLELYCSIGDHRDLGMRALLEIT